MRHVYHYFATYRERNIAGAEWLIDGILDLAWPVSTMERYAEVKQLILDDRRFTAPGNLTIRSLSLMETHE